MVGWVKITLLFILDDCFLFSHNTLICKVLQLDICMLSNFQFLIGDSHIQTNELGTVSLALFCQTHSYQIQTCLLEYFFLNKTVVLWTWIQPFLLFSNKRNSSLGHVKTWLFLKQCWDSQFIWSLAILTMWMKKWSFRCSKYYTHSFKSSSKEGQKCVAVASLPPVQHHCCKHCLYSKLQHFQRACYQNSCGSGSASQYVGLCNVQGPKICRLLYSFYMK